MDTHDKVSSPINLDSRQQEELIHMIDSLRGDILQSKSRARTGAVESPGRSTSPSGFRRRVSSPERLETVDLALAGHRERIPA
jgi:hypothetical protein